MRSARVRDAVSGEAQAGGVPKNGLTRRARAYGVLNAHTQLEHSAGRVKP